MDAAKCKALKRDLGSQPEPQMVAIDRFFDGNDDLGSIGCNVMDHPGISVFRDTLMGLKNRSDITAVYAQITELDPSEDSWPFTDTVLVVGSISLKELQQLLSPLMPDEVTMTGRSPLLQGISEIDQDSILVVWWD